MSQWGPARGVTIFLGLTEPLRSHGGLGERAAPLIINRALDCGQRQLHSYDAVDLALNRVQTQL
jgi:phosphonoacetate hydrolase